MRTRLALAIAALLSGCMMGPDYTRPKIDAPAEFRPERWEGDLLKRIPRFAYFPFGGGPRQCIGNAFAVMEATLILATVAQKYRLRLVPNQPVVPLASITLRPRHGVRVVLESRQPRAAESLSQTSRAMSAD